MYCNIQCGNGPHNASRGKSFTTRGRRLRGWIAATGTGALTGSRAVMAERPKGVTARTCVGQVEVSEASVSTLPPKTRPKGRLRTGEPPGKNRQRSVVGFRAPQRPTPSGGGARSASAQGARPPPALQAPPKRGRVATETQRQLRGGSVASRTPTRHGHAAQRRGWDVAAVRAERM